MPDSEFDVFDELRPMLRRGIGKFWGGTFLDDWEAPYVTSHIYDPMLQSPSRSPTAADACMLEKHKTLLT